MWNPFNNKDGEMNAKKEEADYNMAAAVMGSQAQQMDEMAAEHRREVLVQLTQWQQDRSGVMKSIFFKLSGTYLDDEQKTIRTQDWNKGYCALIGAAKLVDFIEPLDHNVMLANWENKQLIITLRDAIAHPLRRFIFINHNELGIKIEHAEYVLWMIVNTIEPNYWRGWNDGERRKDREIIKVNELRNPYFQQKKKGIFGSEA